jgi:hypothetical protein
LRWAAVFGALIGFGGVAAVAGAETSPASASRRDLAPESARAFVCWEWDGGPSWLRDAMRPSDEWPDLPRGAPEAAIHVSRIEGGDEAAWRNHEGDRAHDGIHATLEAGGRLRVGSYAEIRLRPRLVAASPAARVSWLEAIASVRAGPATLEAGRRRFWLGPGRHGALLLSTNARALDVVHARAAGATPARFPAFPDLASLDGGAAVAFLTDARRDYPNPDLGVLYLKSRWSSWLGLELYRTMMFAGEGRRFRLGWRSVGDLLSARDENIPGDENPSNQIAAAALEVRLDALVAEMRDRAPRRDAGLWAYYEYGGEDNFRGWLIRNPGVIFGLRWAGARWEAGAELANNRGRVVPWYAHSIYTDGYTYRGAILGHHMGGRARDISGSVLARFAGGRAARVFVEREEAYPDTGAAPATLWSIVSGIDDLVTWPRAALSVDAVFRWREDDAVGAFSPIERSRVSLRLSWRPAATTAAAASRSAPHAAPRLSPLSSPTRSARRE